MIRSTSTLKSLLVPSLRVFLIGLCTALTACVATPPSPSLAIALPEAQHTLELNAVFWADKVQHSNNAWQRHQQTFTFRLENIPASQVLELISRELQLGYEMDGCGEYPISMVGREMPLQQVIESLELQAGASVQFEGKQLSMRCEVDELRVYTVDYLSIARQMNDSSSLSSAIAGAHRELTDRRETGNRSELILNNSQQHDLWQDISTQIEQIIQAQIKPVELSTRERIIDEDEDRAYASTRNTSPRRAQPNLRSTTAVSTEKRDITTTRKEIRSGRVIAHPESGTVSVIAKPSQHRRVGQWLSQIQRRVDMF